MRTMVIEIFRYSELCSINVNYTRCEGSVPLSLDSFSHHLLDYRHKMFLVDGVVVQMVEIIGEGESSVLASGT